jgi:glycerophosphoryl diester phosphodiesterase
MTIRRNVLAGLFLALTAALPAVYPVSSYAENAAVKSQHPVLTRLIAEENGQAPTKTGYDKIIAHRGVYQKPITVQYPEMYSVAENSIRAFDRAKIWGFEMVEIDVRLSQAGTPYVIHDKVLNRSTTLDIGTNYNGVTYNLAADTAFNKTNQLTREENARRKKQGRHDLLWEHDDRPYALAIHTGARTNAELNGTKLKMYEPGGEMYLSDAGDLETLSSFLAYATQYTSSPLVVLDLQDPKTTEAAANVIISLGLQKRVVLKFMARSAVDDTGLKNHEDRGPAETIARWGNGLFYVIQVNDGELQNNQGQIAKYGKTWNIIDYINKFRATGRIIGVGISKPYNNVQGIDGKKQALTQVRDYFQTAGRRMPTIGTISNPDFGFKTFGKCFVYSFSGNPGKDGRVKTNLYTIENQTERRDFANTMDYVISDVIPVAENYYGNFIYRFLNGAESFQTALCR